MMKKELNLNRNLVCLMDLIGYDNSDSDSDSDDDNNEEGQAGIVNFNRPLFDSLKDVEENGVEYISIESPGWVEKYNFDEEHIGNIYVEFDSEGIQKLTFEQFEEAIDFIDELAEDMLIQLDMKKLMLKKKLQNNEIL